MGAKEALHGEPDASIPGVATDKNVYKIEISC
jgi:hypothetical protein